MLWKIKYDALYCLLQTGSEGKEVEEMLRQLLCCTQFCPLKPGFIQFKPGLTHWAG